MTPTSLAGNVALRTGKIIKMAYVFWERRKFATKWYTTLCIRT